MSATALHRKDTGYMMRIDDESIFTEMLHLTKWTLGPQIKVQMKGDEDSTEYAKEEIELKGKEEEQNLPKDP